VDRHSRVRKTLQVRSGSGGFFPLLLGISRNGGPAQERAAGYPARPFALAEEAVPESPCEPRPPLRHQHAFERTAEFAAEGSGDV